MALEMAYPVLMVPVARALGQVATVAEGIIGIDEDIVSSVIGGTAQEELAQYPVDKNTLEAGTLLLHLVEFW